MTTDKREPDEPAGHEQNAHDPRIRESLDRYWVGNVRIMATLTTLWLIAGLGCGVLFADTLNRFQLPGTGYPLGFWFAQQGSIIAFVLIILVYCLLMNKLDAKHHAELENLRKKQRGAL
jgi:putative solute:sodium symporter small subunit